MVNIVVWLTYITMLIIRYAEVFLVGFSDLQFIKLKANANNFKNLYKLLVNF
ncbi:hypothetical protein SCO02_14210 [Staphylococcus ureilyticus]|uniref:Uncharacterized protein n=1 Tax=Staphylococcus ureilyticus TaxID=94138 RepID=A0AB34AII8_STAUR|nr:hypothetical protein [Staphylococcus ureilyticus]GEQ02980.1 hypothetical protein SCO02_14210 [Staphylococcus ureilyticus]